MIDKLIELLFGPRRDRPEISPILYFRINDESDERRRQRRLVQLISGSMR